MPDTPSLPSKILSAALRAIRRLRGRRPPELAAALKIQVRSYEHFESGAGRLNVDRVMQFADMTDSDGFAIIAALWIGSPQFAIRCANNKLMTILVIYSVKDANWGHWPEALGTLACLALVAGLQLWRRNPLISIFGGTILYMAVSPWWQ